MDRSNNVYIDWPAWPILEYSSAVWDFELLLISNLLIKFKDTQPDVCYLQGWQAGQRRHFAQGPSVHYWHTFYCS